MDINSNFQQLFNVIALHELNNLEKTSSIKNTSLSNFIANFFVGMRQQFFHANEILIHDHTKGKIKKIDLTQEFSNLQQLQKLLKRINQLQQIQQKGNQGNASVVARNQATNEAHVYGRNLSDEAIHAMFADLDDNSTASQPAGPLTIRRLSDEEFEELCSTLNGSIHSLNESILDVLSEAKEAKQGEAASKSDKGSSHDISTAQHAATHPEARPVRKKTRADRMAMTLSRTHQFKLKALILAQVIVQNIKDQVRSRKRKERQEQIEKENLNDDIRQREIDTRNIKQETIQASETKRRRH